MHTYTYITYWCMAGLDDDICERLHALFMARWAYFHTPLFTAAHFLESEYIAIKPTGKEKMCASKPLLLGHECYLAWLPGCGLLAFRWPSERTFRGRKANETFRPSAFRNIQAFLWTSISVLIEVSQFQTNSPGKWLHQGRSPRHTYPGSHETAKAGD